MKEKIIFYYKNDINVLNKVLYNIKITIFAPEIKSERSLTYDGFKHV